MPLSNKKHNAAMAAEQQNLAASGALGGAPGAGAAANANANLPGPAPFTAGPHKHDIMNKLDPTVDSGTGGMQVLTGGAHNNTAAAGFPGGFPGQPIGGGQMPAGGGVMGSNNPYGAQHNSRMANALDPRVDFAQGQAGGANYYTKGTNVVPGAAAQPRNVPEGTYGPHSSRMANAADPRVDSDADRHRTRGAGAGAQSNAKPIFPAGVAGPAPTTAGPHRHDILNKLDPAVDSRNATNVDATGRRLV
ncbi:hypothetical protein HDV62DRAFT_218673 [Trichoderma sp. SZMC 28011]